MTDYFDEPKHVLDINKAADLQLLVTKGWIWASGPRTQQQAIDAIVAGDVKRNPETEPPAITEYLDRTVAQAPRPPVPQDDNGTPPTP